MWNCPNCSEQIKDTIHHCWNCGAKYDTIFVKSPKFGSLPISLSNFDLGLGRAATAMTVLIVTSVAAVFAAFSAINEFQPPWIVTSLVLGGMAAASVWALVALVSNIVLTIRLDKEITIRHITHSRTVSLSDLTSIQFDSDVHYMLLPIPFRPYRVATFHEKGGRKFECVVSTHQMGKLREAFGDSASKSKVTS